MRTFNASDYQMIEKWYAQHDLPIIPFSDLPSIGCIVDDVAAGFMMVTDNQMEFLDFYISNPYSDKDKRDEALDNITSFLISKAKLMHLKALFCNTELESVRSRALRLDFTSLGTYHSFMKGL